MATISHTDATIDIIGFLIHAILAKRGFKIGYRLF